ncbi:mycofactocin biosynthesis peptidyl-dipeptidase MftE [Microbacterium sp. X-17]|uniref:mycofactocin biosynthesis peptidyl-dipeptidase MftE n=1 Tax=Microbacterium sp. X-17 TaxID=3144404 RepID=UPI0031F4C142
MHPLDASPDLGERTWETTGAPLLLVPLGSTEQHGPHLPLATDALVAQAVAEELRALCAADGTDTVVGPLLAYGASGEHEGFPGTISIGTEALVAVLVELGRSASAWAPRLVVVNGHGGNVEALRRAIPLLRAEGRDAAWLPCSPGPQDRPADLHAGWVETSLVARIAPGLVRGDRATAGDTRAPAELLPDLRRQGVRAIAPNGVLGDPAGADADHGAALLADMVRGARDRLARGRVDDGGMLT